MKKIHLVFSTLFLTVYFSYAQTKSQDKIYETYDKIVGLENSFLFNGTEFIDLFLNTDGTYRYFMGYDYVRGSIIYSGQYYSNVLLKYDILEDNLLTHSEGKLSIFNVKLLPEFVESFSIYNRNFVRLTDTKLSLSGNGYFEVAYLGGELQLYVKQNKRKKDKALSRGVQYKFFNNNYYLLKKKDKYVVISSIKDLKNALPERADEIRDFYKSYKKLYKLNPDSFMTKLMTSLDNSLKSQNKK